MTHKSGFQMVMTGTGHRQPLYDLALVDIEELSFNSPHCIGRGLVNLSCLVSIAHQPENNTTGYIGIFLKYAIMIVNQGNNTT